jgi:hypothetical protein
MLIPLEMSTIWVLALAIPNFVLCTWLEIRFRRRLRDGLIDESKYCNHQLAEIRRMRERMLSKEDRKRLR